MVKSDAIDFGVHLQEILIAFVAPLTTDDGPNGECVPESLPKPKQ